MPERLTRKNGSGTYRVPMATQGELDLKWQQGKLNVFGELANRLGQYEDLGTVKELTELKNRIKNSPYTAMYGQGLASFRKQLMKTIYHLRGAGSS